MHSSLIFKRTVHEPRTATLAGSSHSSFRDLFYKLETLRLTNGVVWEDLQGSDHLDNIDILESIVLSVRRLVAQTNHPHPERVQELLVELSHGILSFVVHYPQSPEKDALTQQCRGFATPLHQNTTRAQEASQTDFVTIDFRARSGGSNAQIERRKIEQMVLHTKSHPDQSWQHNPAGANSLTVTALRQSNHIAFSGAQWSGRLSIVNQDLQSINPVNPNFDKFGYWLGEYKSNIISLLFAKPELIVFKNWLQSLDPTQAAFQITAVKLGGTQEVSRGYMGGNTDRVGRGALIVKGHLLVPMRPSPKQAASPNVEVLRVFPLQQIIDSCSTGTFDASSLAKVFTIKDLGINNVEGFTQLPKQRSGQTSASGIDESTAVIFSSDKIRLMQFYENGMIEVDGGVSDVPTKVGAMKITSVESFDDFLVIAYRGAPAANSNEPKTTRLGLARRRAGNFVFEKAQDINQEQHVHQMVPLYIRDTRMVITLTANSRVQGWFVNPYDENEAFTLAFKRHGFTCGEPGTLLAQPFKPRSLLANKRNRTLDLVYACNEPTRISLTFG